MRALVTSVRVERFGAHEQVKVWTRGGLAGVLVVSEGDGKKLGKRLLGGEEGGRWDTSSPLDGPTFETGLAEDDGP